jgi:hypothetical protein
LFNFLLWVLVWFLSFRHSVLNDRIEALPNEILDRYKELFLQHGPTARWRELFFADSTALHQVHAEMNMYLISRSFKPIRIKSSFSNVFEFGVINTAFRLDIAILFLVNS